MLLSYLVTSRARRDLLRLLWVDRTVGSVSDLARQARVSFAAAHHELEAMRAAGLASSERAGRTLAYRANREHPQSALVQRLLKDGTAAVRTAPPRRTDRVRGWLTTLGAPLLVSLEVSGRMPSLEKALAEALTLSHDDATVARVLPLVFWAQRDRVDYDRLVREATRLNERQTLGFFLELTGRLARDHRLASLSRRLRDRRRSRVRPFFSRPHGRMALAAARRKTPSLARRWGYLMNMGLESFASAFAKHRQVV